MSKFRSKVVGVVKVVDSFGGIIGFISIVLVMVLVVVQILCGLYVTSYLLKDWGVFDFAFASEKYVGAMSVVMSLAAESWFLLLLNCYGWKYLSSRGGALTSSTVLGGAVTFSLYCSLCYTSHGSFAAGPMPVNWVAVVSIVLGCFSVFFLWRILPMSWSECFSAGGKRFFPKVK